jgi:ParB-like chromosome segregation protein Spo0J
MMEDRLIKDIVIYDKNPRDNKLAIDRVLESLKIHGQVKPLVLSAKGKPFTDEVLCAGHTTLEALKKFGAENVKVVVKEFDSEKEFVDYNIRDNKTGEFASWDEEVLASLKADFEIDLEEMGFTDFEDVDYSVLGGDDDDDEEAQSMAEDVKKSIQIDFKIEDYEEAKKLIDEARKNEVYIGGKLIECLTK